MFSTIRARLLWLVVFALVPAVAILAYDEYLFHQQVFRGIQEDARRVVSLAGLQIQAHVEETRKRCRLLAEFPEIQAVNASSNGILADLLREEPLYTNLAIVDMTGRVVSSALPFEGEVRVGDRPLFKRSGDGLGCTERTFVKVFFAQPVGGSKLQFIGFLINQEQGRAFCFQCGLDGLNRGHHNILRVFTHRDGLGDLKQGFIVHPVLFHGILLFWCG